MEIGPLEYVVIGFQDTHFTDEVIPALNAIQQTGAVRVVDLLFVRKDAEGTVTIQELSEFSEDDLHAYEGMMEDLVGLFTTEDVAQLVEQLPASASAVILLLEHTWALDLKDAVSKAGGVLFTGGMVSLEALQQVSAELEAAKEANHA